VAKVQLPDQKTDVPAYVKSNAPQTTEKVSAEVKAEVKTETSNQNSESVINNFRPIDASAKTLQITPTVDSSKRTLAVEQTSLKEDAPKASSPVADLQILPTLSEMKKGERTKLAVMIKSATAFRSAVLGLKFDQTKVAIRTVSFGDVFGTSLVQTTVTPFLNQSGKMFVSLSSAKEVAEMSSGILAYVEIEALADGKPEISFDADALNMLTADGKNFAVKF